ncbi:PREDICTED: von Willebrand factor [Dipodomys ordii]|uniref:von Willebrand factor n=1 Tax=Dipodomys ordii TaxID=10020 RepID=A0A1S3FRR0_DIPOR|nr:PREDICTED: von Willebrand factor [Dipodomys ordii]
MVPSRLTGALLVLAFTMSVSLSGDFENGQRVGLSVYLGEYFDLHLFANGTMKEGEQNVSVPYASHGLYLETQAGYYRLSSETYGFVARMDTSGNFQVQFSDRLFNKTCGLCGDFNVFAEDDFRTQEGILTSDPYDFANSWALSGEEQRCPRASPPSMLCNSSSVEMPKAPWEQCQLLTSSSAFARCRPWLDPEPFVALCEQTLCACSRGPACACPALLEYARACAHQGLVLDGWTELSVCRPACPAGMEYKECVSPCASTCHGLPVRETCPETCVDGCSCPEGQLLDEGRCVQPAQCSCVHAGKRHPPGSSVPQDCNTCICRKGVWICSNEECPGECLVTGQGHFKSFDNRHFTFSGICQYQLAKDCLDHSFSVVIETMQCADDVDAVCTRSVTVRLPAPHNSLVKLKHGGEVTMDNLDIQLPLLQGDLRIQHTVMPSVRLSFGEDMELDWDGRGRLLLKLSPVYWGRTCGLCGNYNGNQGDDFLTPAGLVEPLVADFGNSWKLQADCQDLESQDRHPCSLNPRLARFAEEACGVLMSSVFEACHPAISPRPYVRNCQYDVCACSDGHECLCASVASYAQACARRGVVIPWRQPGFCGGFETRPNSPVLSRAVPFPFQSLRAPVSPVSPASPRVPVSPMFPCPLCPVSPCPMSPCSRVPRVLVCPPCPVSPVSRVPCPVSPCPVSPCPVSRVPMSRVPMSRVPCPVSPCPPCPVSPCPVSRVPRVPCSVSPMSVFPRVPVSPVSRVPMSCVPYCAEGRMHCTARAGPGALALNTGLGSALSHRGKRSLSCRPPMVKLVCPADNPHAQGIECAKTCQNYDLECMSPGCVSGCLCPLGMVRHDNRCVALERCPCFHQGREYAPGETVKMDCNTCVCRDRKWNCTDHVCDATCSVLGVAHYITFDGLKYLFPGECQYVLVQDHCDGSPGTFRVLVGNEGCGPPAVACQKRVTILAEGGEVELLGGEVSVKRPLEDESLLEVVESGRYLIVLLGRTLSVVWDRHRSLSVVLKQTFQGRVCGLCGNFDGVQNNDLTSSSLRVEEDPVDFGNSWKVSAQCADARKAPLGMAPTLCGGDLDRQSVADSSCRILTSDLFHACNQLVDPEPYLDVCVYDTCSCESVGDCACFCDTIAAYAHACAQQGQVVAWRTPTLCPQSCEDRNARENGYECEWRYNSCAPACPITCQHPEPLACPVQCVEGCHAHCPPGKAWPGREREEGEGHCDGANLTCEACLHPRGLAGPPTEAPAATPTPDVEDTPEPPLHDFYCSKLLDLVFLLDGSAKLSEAEFEELKGFVVSVMERLHISQKRIRVALVEFHDGSHAYLELRARRRPSELRRVASHVKYVGSQVASTSEVMKYTLFQIFGQIDRPEALRVTLLLTASQEPPRLARNLVRYVQGLKKKKVVVIPVGIGPHANLRQIRLIEKQAPENKAFVLSGVGELAQRRDDIISYICDLAPEPLPPTQPPPQAQITTASPEISGSPSPGSHRKPLVLDVVFVLEGSDQVGEENFQKSKEFVQEVVGSLAVGPDGVHVSVLQYSNSVMAEYSFNHTQTADEVLHRLREIPYRGGNRTNTGLALEYLASRSFSPGHGDREQAPNLVYMVTGNPASDEIRRLPGDIQVIPIGVGPHADVHELEKVGYPNAPILIQDFQKLPREAPDLVLQRLQLPMLPPPLGSVGICVDEDGNERRPGDVWTLPDRCHTVTCQPDGQTLLTSHRVNCDRGPRPSCPNSQSPVRVEETCGCRWTCPCVCTGSATRHLVTFDGQNFQLTGSCAYVLFQSKEQGLEVIARNGACGPAPRQMCVKSIEVKHGGISLELHDDMEVSVDGRLVPAPYVGDHVEVSIYGAIMYEVRFNQLGHILTFTPQNNEFQLQLSPKTYASKTYGLCGICDGNAANDFVLKDGSVTTDWKGLVEEWAVQQPGYPTCHPVPEDACPVSDGSRCQLLLSPLFAECHQVLAPATFHAICQQDSCHQERVCEVIASYAHLCRSHGVCVDWRTADFCAMSCPPSKVYKHCEHSCPRHCDGNSSSSSCGDHPAEGCFCPPNQAVLDGSCVPEEACTQCVGQDGVRHQFLETWVPDHQPCQICMCLSGREINCTSRPCPTARAPTCGACEVARLRHHPSQCCPEYECVCDLVTCDVPPMPACEGGLQPVLTNPGECRPSFACACKKEACGSPTPPSCPPHRTPVLRSTRCCDQYECAATCVSSTAASPTGETCEAARSLTEPLCLQVCVHRGTVYPVGQVWEEGCTLCTCTDAEDVVTGLRTAWCSPKPCEDEDGCRPGFSYVLHEGDCCGRCLPSACEVMDGSPRGDAQSSWKSVGTRWAAQENPCLINQCVRVNEEVFVQQSNVSCPPLDVPTCPTGFQLSCETSACCPSCRCEPMEACVLNSTIIGPGKSVMVDVCTTCHCSTQPGAVRGFKLECTKTTCEACPPGYLEEKGQGECCGRCRPSACTIRLRGGQVLALKRDETVQDGCDSHFCRVNERGEFIWEKRVTRCPPFDEHRCLAEGGKIMKIPGTCCDTCEEVDCRDVTASVKYIKVGDCKSQDEVDIHYCQVGLRGSRRWN